MLVLGFLLVHYVGAAVSPIGDGAHGDRPDVFPCLLRRVASGNYCGAEDHKITREGLAHRVLSEHCDGSEHGSHHRVQSR